MKKHGVAIWFVIITAILLAANIVLILIFTFIKLEDSFYSSLNVASLSIAFLSFIASSFFSLSVYLQTEAQGKINESLPKKDDQYIIANYSLFNIEGEFSLFSLRGDEKNLVQLREAYLMGDSDADEVTRLVFLPTDSMNAPTYKVIIKSISLHSSKNEEIYYASGDGVDGEYSANILKRGYNCISVDLALPMTRASEMLKNVHHLELTLDIISVFNVCMSMRYNIYIGGAKDVEGNPDRKTIPDLETYIIHHSNYLIEEKSILR